MTERDPYAGRVGDEYAEQQFTKWLAGETTLDELGDILGATGARRPPIGEIG